jgi:hypothetical protein
MRYERRVAKGLERVFEHAGERHLELDWARCAILSDQHKGSRDGADDFRVCEQAYNAALDYYLKHEFTLYALGDVEELWECRPPSVLRAYANSLELDAAFNRNGRYVRFFGNHDDEWSAPRAVRRHLAPIFDSHIEVLEGLKLAVRSGGKTLGTVFLVHGHQGTLFSDRLRPIAKRVVRYIWRPIQRLTRIPSNTPATDFELRNRHDRAMWAWAAAKSKVVLVAGHTHRPVFMSQSLLHLLQQQIAALEQQLRQGPSAPFQQEIERLCSLLEWAQLRDSLPLRLSTATETPPKPCYFNSGCCCFCDGEVTGIEIVEGRLRLVRWSRAAVAAEILFAEDLRAVLARCP